MILGSRLSATLMGICAIACMHIHTWKSLFTMPKCHQSDASTISQAFSYINGHMRDCTHAHLYVEIYVTVAKEPSVRCKHHQPEQAKTVSIA
jgi:hypothetical protein